MLERLLGGRARARAAAVAALASVTSTKPNVIGSDSETGRDALAMSDDDPRPKWEYIPIIVPNAADLILSLNKAGKDGWEIICPTGAVDGGTMWLAKRRKRAIIDAPEQHRRILTAR